MEERTIEIKGKIVKYLERNGQGPLIFLHGIAANRYSWEKTAAFMPEKYRLLMPDIGFMGNEFGLDEFSDWLSGFIGQLNIKKAVFIGHSLGGLLALRTAVSFPELAEKLIIISSPLADLKKNKLFNELAQRVGNKKRREEMVENYQKHQKFFNLVLEAIYQAPSSEQRKEILKKLLFFASDFASYNWQKDCQRINCPVLFVYGRKDPLLNLFKGKEGYFWLKGAAVKKLEGSHRLPKENSKELASVIIAFLEKETDFSFLKFLKTIISGN
jgi:pimeloyl-ACP methyl ester carboxylesterase